VKTLSATLSASGNGQSSGVTTKLPLPLRVVVDSAGTKVPGVQVNWRASGGTLVPASGVTDAAGIATATWTLDTVAGALSATAISPGLRDTVTFGATAAPGPAAALKKFAGDNQTVGVNAAFAFPLGVDATDRYGNPVMGQVAWTIEHGPVTFTVPSSGPTNEVGTSYVSFRPVGTQGSALVRASLSGTAATADFNVTVGPARYLVLLNSGADYGTGLIHTAFVSIQNSSTNPAVDTIPSGQTVVWMLPGGLAPHRVVSLGTPSFPDPGDPLPSADPTVSVTFTVPGTYQYADFYNAGATGTIVVQ
jgi:plastocyanin